MKPVEKPKLERVSRGGHTSHVGRTLEWFRKYGFIAEKVEKRALIVRPGMPPGMARIGPSQDLYGVADIVAIPPPWYTGRQGAWFVQVCARGGGAAHRKKALEANEKPGVSVLPRLDSAGCRFLIVNYELNRSVPKDKRKTGRLVWVRRVEEYVDPRPMEILPGAINWTAGFVDWTDTDFALVEVRPSEAPETVSPVLDASNAARLL